MGWGTVYFMVGVFYYIRWGTLNFIVRVPYHIK